MHERAPRESMRAMTEAEARSFVKHNKFGLLSLAEGGRAYGLPLFYGYDGRAVYFHVHPGLKTQFARMTAEACFTIVRVVSLDDWASVQLFGRLERVGDGPERMAAHQALMGVPLPPEWGESLQDEPLHGDAGAVTYRLAPLRATGRYSQTPGIREGAIATQGM
jgi:nitroimidazol reductase NimA-like FMN-containing flavoprotein (pyridoxamine 5'-phosphate oxidase superfamily)